MKAWDVTIERSLTVQLKQYTPFTVRIQISGNIEQLDDMTKYADGYIFDQINDAVAGGVERYGIK